MKSNYQSVENKEEKDVASEDGVHAVDDNVLNVIVDQSMNAIATSAASHLLGQRAAPLSIQVSTRQ